VRGTTLFSSGDSLGFVAIYWVNCTGLSVSSLVCGVRQLTSLRSSSPEPRVRFRHAEIGHLHGTRKGPATTCRYVLLQLYVMYIKRQS
jgi:hypothetical protein